MKKIFSLFLFFTLANSVFGGSVFPKSKYQIPTCNISDTAAYPIASISSVNLPFYYNKPINIFLADLADAYPGYILGKVYGNQIRWGKKINVYYGNDITFIIVVKNFQFMNPFNLTGNFDINLFRQENINKIELRNIGDCIHGCN